MPDEPNTTRRWDAAVRAESLSWSIVRQIREALFGGQLKPGDFLGSEITLAQEFGVSRMAARDALRSLSAMGIVEIRMGSRGGAWVAAGNPDRLVDALSIQLRLIGVTAEEMLEMQSAISVVAAELAAEHKIKASIDRMRAAAQAAEASVTDSSAFTAASLQFHECLVEGSQNRVLFAQFLALKTVLQPLLLANTTPGAIRRVIKSNATLLAAISAGDIEAAGQAMRDRVTSIRSGILGMVKPGQAASDSGANRASVQA